MAFSIGASMGLKEPALGVAMRDLSGPTPPVYATVDSVPRYFNPADYSQQQRDYLIQRNMLNQSDGPHGPHFNVNEGTKGSQATHDFFSLYDDNSSQYAEQHESGRGLSSSLTTKDFLQPLERGGNHASSFREVQPPCRGEKHARAESVSHGNSVAPVTVERILSNSMGGYNGGHVTTYGRVNGPIELPSTSHVRIVGEANVEAARNRAFTNPAGPLSTREDHEARSELSKDQDDASARENMAYWSNMRLKFGMLPDMGFTPPSNPPLPHTVIEVQPPVASISKQWPQPTSQGLIDIAKRPARVPSEDDEDDEDEYADRSSSRKEQFPKSDVSSQKVDSKTAEARGGTPRSKHSATEQRRRSKINDRFQMLRELVPHSDQKRDKASFLLEVIEYIQVLQDKVRKYETAEHGRNQERLKSMVWDLCKRGTGSGGDALADPSHSDAMALAKEYGPSVAGVSIDVKQGTEGSEGGTPRVSSSAAMDENANSECLQPDLQQISRPISAIQGSAPSADERENSNGGGKSGAPQLQVQTPFGRNYTHQQQSKQSHSVTEAQALTEGKSLKSASTHTNALYDPDKTSEAEETTSRAQVNSQPPQGEGASEDQQLDLRYQGEQDGINGPGLSSSDDYGTAKSQAKVDRQHVFGSSQRHPQLSPQRNDSPSSARSGQQLAGCSDQYQQKDEFQASGSGQDPLAIQGGVINVSSVYSQGLLDTLTRALQSSGLDLSQANISVQIDLCKSISAPAAGPSLKVGASTLEPSGQSHQPQNLIRQVACYPDPDAPPLKRPKLEMELN